MRFRLPLRRTVFFLAALGRRAGRAAAAAGRDRLVRPRRPRPRRARGRGQPLVRHGCGKRNSGRSRSATSMPGSTCCRSSSGGRGCRCSRDEAAGGRFDGAITVTRHSFGLDDLTGQLRTGALFAPLPMATLDLERRHRPFRQWQLRERRGRGPRRPVRRRRRDHAALGPARHGPLRRGRAAAAADRPVRHGAAQHPHRGERALARGPRRPRRPIRPRSSGSTAAGFVAGPGGYVRRIDGSF